MNSTDDSWRKLVNAARRAAAEEPPPPPNGFARRIVGLRDSITALVRLACWRRWTTAGALLCFGVFLVLFGLRQCSPAERAPLIEAPPPPIPSP